MIIPIKITPKKPSPNSGVPRPNARGPRPHIWKAGPDPAEHKRYCVWLQQKNQAQFREEGWTIPFEEWKAIWEASGHWEDRGRITGTWCMTRKDWSTPWTEDNVIIVTREEHARMQGEAVRNGWRSPARKKYRARMGIPDIRLKPGRKPRNP